VVELGHEVTGWEGRSRAHLIRSGDGEGEGLAAQMQ
jgi:hypothetical protein